MVGYGRQIWNEPSALLQSKRYSFFYQILHICDNRTPVQNKSIVKLCKHHCLEAQVAQFSLSMH